MSKGDMVKITVEEKAALVNACVFYVNEFPDADANRVATLRKIADTLIADKQVADFVWGQIAGAR